jgi:hypothetical protein
MSCNNVNRELEFYLDVATGNIAGVSNVSKFGYNPSISKF